MKVKLFDKKILVEEFEPDKWPGLHHIPRTDLVDPEGKPLTVTGNFHFRFGKVVDVSEDCLRLKAGDLIFWPFDMQASVLEDFLMMPEAAAIGTWKPWENKSKSKYAAAVEQANQMPSASGLIS